MDAFRYRRMQEIFETLTALDPAERAAALARYCAEDPGLGQELESLLAERPAAERYFAGLAARAGIAPPTAEDLVHAAGTRIGPWRLLRQIGRGGMGVVYEAERADGQFDMRVALKVVPVGLVTAESQHRFQRERNILARLNHPGVAQLLDGGITTEGTPYLVMELVEGSPLDVYCNQRDLGLRARLALFRQVCEVVAYAHRNLVVHRDLKPSNVFVSDRDGRPKLLDFGVARLLESEADNAVTAAMGAHPLTPAYCAPEVLLGEPASTAADVYSLGVILFKLLTGRLPLTTDKDSPAAWTELATNGVPPQPSSVIAEGRRARQLRGDLDSIIAMALRREPERRYPNADALFADLERHEKRLPVRARKDSFRYHAARFVARYRVPVSIAGLMLGLVLGGALALAHYASIAREEAHNAERAGQRAQAVAGFLAEVFSAADPYEQTAGEPTAGELLDRGVSRIGQSDLDPESRARVLVQMARIYRRLSRYANAATLLERAHELAQGLPEPDPLLEGEVLLEMAAREYESGELSLAAAHAREVLDLLERSGNQEGRLHAETLYRYGIILQEQGQYDQALSTLRSALASRQSMPAPDALSSARVLDKIGFTLEKMSRYEESREHYLRAIETTVTQLPEDDLDLAEFRNDLGRVLWRLKDFPEAAEQHARVLATRIERLGPDHRATGISHNNLGVALYSMGRAEDGARHVAEAVRIHTAGLGDNHWLPAREKYVLALILTDLGEHERATDLYQAAFRITRETYGPSHRDVVMMLAGRAYMLSRRGEFTEAERHAREALSLMPDIGSGQERFRRVALSRLAVSLAGQGRLIEAESIASELCGSESSVDAGIVTAYTEPCSYARLSISAMANAPGERSAPLR